MKMTEKFARRLFSARLHVFVHAAPRTDYFDCREPIKRHSVDEFAGKFADVSRSGGWRRGAARDCESKSDDGKSSPHAGKRSTPRNADEMSHTRRRNRVRFMWTGFSGEPSPRISQLNGPRSSN